MQADYAAQGLGNDWLADLSTMVDDNRLIYDFGMNDGSSTEYYLTKGVRVVGVEANPRKCEEVHQRFRTQIAKGQLIVLPVALSDRDTDELLTFYVHKTHDVLSQVPKPSDLTQFHTIEVPCRTASSIIREYGPPLYVKIDIEHFDQVVLRELFSAGIFPPEISAEAHSVDIFAQFVANGYTAFNLVDGGHSAGPFGDDIGRPWEDPDTFLYTLASAGLGWKDVHASRTFPVASKPSKTALACRQGIAAARMLYRALRS